MEDRNASALWPPKNLPNQQGCERDATGTTFTANLGSRPTCRAPFLNSTPRPPHQSRNLPGNRNQHPLGPGRNARTYPPPTMSWPPQKLYGGGPRRNRVNTDHPRPEATPADPVWNQRSATGKVREVDGSRPGTDSNNEDTGDQALRLVARFQRAREPLDALARDIYKLVRETYTTRSTLQVDNIARDVFLHAVDDSEMEWFVKTRGSTSLYKAIEEALRFEEEGTCAKFQKKLGGESWERRQTRWCTQCGGTGQTNLSQLRERPAVTRPNAHTSTPNPPGFRPWEEPTRA